MKLQHIGKTLLAATVILIAFAITSCASTGSATENDADPFVQQFLDYGAYIQIDGEVLSLRSDVSLPEGASLELKNGKTWMLNLNGHTIIQKHPNGAPAIDVIKGTLAIANGNKNKNLGGIVCDGLCIRVNAKGSLQINAGTFTGADYVVEVLSGGYLKITGGRFQSYVTPLKLEKGWAGNLTGGLYSSYDPSYDQAILGNSYASIRLGKENSDFLSAWKNAVIISQKTPYQGATGLKLSTTRGYMACFRLYKTHQTDSFLKAEDCKPAYEWIMYPGQTQEVYFEAGSYVLKIAEGYHWSLTEAFGEEGTYWEMEPFNFEDGVVYSVHTDNEMETYNPDTYEGFMTGLYEQKLQ